MAVGKWSERKEKYLKIKIKCLQPRIKTSEVERTLLESAWKPSEITDKPTGK